MNIQEQRYALRFEVELQAVTGMLLRSGRQGEYTDSTVEKTGDRKLHINGYVWASLLRRALSRCANWHKTAEGWGKYEAQAGVAPLWTEATFVEEKGYLVAVNHGNGIDRQWGSVAQSALYSDEIAFPQAPMVLRGTVFAPTLNKAEGAREALLDACQVIGQGIETIGGGWSYGFGRLIPLQARTIILDLAEESDRKRLWQTGQIEVMETLTRTEIEQRTPAIRQDRGWGRLTVNCCLADGQLLAIHTDVPELGVELGHGLPDSFVFTRPALTGGGSLTATPVITGKAFRQAVLSREIERRLRGDEGACLDTSDAKRIATHPDDSAKRRCLCKRCLWFGDTDAGGIVSVGDALVENYASEIVHRIQLCEHSGQTMQKKLFDGEYLTRGLFAMNILIDHARGEQMASDELQQTVLGLLEEMRPDGNAPPGWHRLGATSTCTGQLSVTSITVQRFPAEEEHA